MQPLLYRIFIASWLGLSFLLATPAPSARAEVRTNDATPVPPTPTSSWDALQAATPVPYTAPLPVDRPTALDGLYAKVNPAPPQWWACRRCADYRPAGGVWRLQFDRGVMRIWYAVTGWRSYASYTVEDDRLRIFNDPFCPDAVGEYRWRQSNEALMLELVGDGCAFGLRGRNLSAQPWQSCAAGAPGCRDTPPPAAAAGNVNAELTVRVTGGDARFADPPPTRLADANPAARAAPAGLTVTASDGSIGYGLNRVLWQADDWVAVEVDEGVERVGVQFLGDHVIGWARVLFDGEEVWRGDTRALSEALGRFGGYIEVSGFAPGIHELRVERLDYLGKPVVVAFFGAEAGCAEAGCAGSE